MKKILSVCLSLIMILFVFAMPTSAAVIEEFYFNVAVDDVNYVLYDDMALAMGFDFDEEDTSPKPGIVIPETITHEGKNFTVIGIFDMAFSESDYTSVTLPSTITYMGSAAFASSPYLENVVIPADCNFEYFGEDVFIGTPFEEKIYSKDEVIFGKNVLFSYIGNADEYVIPENIEIIVSKCFFMSGLKNIVFNEKVTEIPYLAFASCRNLTEVNIPDNIEMIGDGAFKDCTNLQKVILGEKVHRLGVDCFANTKIKSIHLGAEVYDITGAFKDCKTLESITVDPANTALLTDGKALYFKTTFVFDGEEREGLILKYYLPSKAQGKITLNASVGAIEDYAFYGCNGLEEVVAKDLEYVGSQAFCNSSIKKFSAKGDYWVWDAAFRNCKNLESINLENVEYIGVGAFENCTSLENVTFSESIGEISELAFSNTGLKNVAIQGNDCYVYESAFKGCKNLETVRLEEGVTGVGMNAFLGCPELKTIYISKTVKSIDDKAFNGCENVSFQVIEDSAGHNFVEDAGYDYEIVGRLSFFERIAAFFENLINLLFGWII